MIQTVSEGAQPEGNSRWKLHAGYAGENVSAKRPLPAKCLALSFATPVAITLPSMLENLLDTLEAEK